MKFLKKNKLILKNYLKVWNSNYLFTSSVNIFSLVILFPAMRNEIPEDQ